MIPPRIRVWSEAGRGAFSDLPAASGPIVAIIPLVGGGIAYGAGDSSFGVFDAGGRKTLERRGAIGDFRWIKEGFKVSRDGAHLHFSFEASGKSPARFGVSERRVSIDLQGDA